MFRLISDWKGSQTQGVYIGDEHIVSIFSYRPSSRFSLQSILSKVNLLHGSRKRITKFPQALSAIEAILQQWWELMNGHQAIYCKSIQI